MKANKEIKSTARRLLQGNYSTMIGLFLAAYVIQSIIVSIPSTILASPTSIPLFLSQIILSMLLEALGAMIMLGLSRGALQLVRGNQFGLADLIYSFKHQGDHFLALELILVAINTVTYIPGYIFSWINASSDMSLLTYFIDISLLDLLSTVLTFLITLIFAMSEFVMLDFPDLTAGEALRTSMKLMKGHIGQYFLLILSFIGFLILGISSAMIGFLWVVPYMVVSEAVFYENLCILSMQQTAEETY